MIENKATRGAPPTREHPVARRRLVGFERHYRCASCGAERHSWSRMSACPDCGEAYVSAVIRRAALV